METRRKTRSATKKCRASSLIPVKTRSCKEKPSNDFEHAKEFLKDHQDLVVNVAQEAGPSMISSSREKTRSCKEKPSNDFEHAKEFLKDHQDLVVNVAQEAGPSMISSSRENLCYAPKKKSRKCAKTKGFSISDDVSIKKKSMSSKEKSVRDLKFAKEFINRHREFLTKHKKETEPEVLETPVVEEASPEVLKKPGKGEDGLSNINKTQKKNSVKSKRIPKKSSEITKDIDHSNTKSTLKRTQSFKFKETNDFERAREFLEDRQDLVKNIAEEAGPSTISSSQEKCKQPVQKRQSDEKKGPAKTSSLIPKRVMTPNTSQIEEKINDEEKGNILLNMPKRHVTFSDPIEAYFPSPSQSISSPILSPDSESIENEIVQVANQNIEKHICHFDICLEPLFIDLSSSGDEGDTQKEAIVNQISTADENEQKQNTQRIEVENNRNFADSHSLESNSKYFCCRKKSSDERISHDDIKNSIPVDPSDNEKNPISSDSSDEEENILLTRSSLSFDKSSVSSPRKHSNNGFDEYYKLFSECPYSLYGTPDMLHCEDEVCNQVVHQEKMDIEIDDDISKLENDYPKNFNMITKPLSYTDLVINEQEEKLDLPESNSNDKNDKTEGLNVEVSVKVTNMPKKTYKYNNLLINESHETPGTSNRNSGMMKPKTKSKILDYSETIIKTNGSSEEPLKCNNRLTNEHGKLDSLDSDSKPYGRTMTPNSKKIANFENSEPIANTEAISTLQYFEELETLLSNVVKEEKNEKLWNKMSEDKLRKNLNVAKEHEEENKNLYDAEAAVCISHNQKVNKTSTDQTHNLHDSLPNEKELNDIRKKNVSLETKNRLLDSVMSHKELFQKKNFPASFKQKLVRDKISLDKEGDSIQNKGNDDSADDFRETNIFSRTIKQAMRRNSRPKESSKSTEKNKNNNIAEGKDNSMVKMFENQPKEFEASPIDLLNHGKNAQSKLQADVKFKAEQSPNSLGSEDLFSYIKFSGEGETNEGNEMTNPFLLSCKNLNTSQNKNDVYLFQPCYLADASESTSVNSSTKKGQMNFMNSFKQSCSKSKTLKIKNETKKKTKNNNKHETSKLQNPNFGKRCDSSDVQKYQNISPIKNIVPSNTIIGYNHMSTIPDKSSLANTTSVKSKSSKNSDLSKIVNQDEEMRFMDSEILTDISKISPVLETEEVSKFLQSPNFPKYGHVSPQCSTAMKNSNMPKAKANLKMGAYNFNNQNLQTPSSSYDFGYSTSHNISSLPSMTIESKARGQTDKAEKKWPCAMPMASDTKERKIKQKYGGKKFLNSKADSKPKKERMKQNLNEEKDMNAYELQGKKAIPKMQSNRSSNTDFKKLNITHKSNKQIDVNWSKSKQYSSAFGNASDTVFETSQIANSSNDSKKINSTSGESVFAMDLSDPFSPMFTKEDSFSSVEFKGNDMESALVPQNSKELSNFKADDQSGEASLKEQSKIQNATKMQVKIPLSETRFSDKSVNEVSQRNSLIKQDFNPKTKLKNTVCGGPVIRKKLEVKRSFPQKRKRSDSSSGSESDSNGEPQMSFAQSNMQANKFTSHTNYKRMKTSNNEPSTFQQKKSSSLCAAKPKGEAQMSFAQADMQANKFTSHINYKRMKTSNNEPSTFQQKTSSGLSAAKPKTTFHLNSKEFSGNFQTPTTHLTMQRQKPEILSTVGDVVANMRQCAGVEQRCNNPFMSRCQSMESSKNNFELERGGLYLAKKQNPKSLPTNIIAQTDIYAIKSTTTFLNAKDNDRAQTSGVPYAKGCYTGQESSSNQIFPGEGDNRPNSNFYETAINAVSQLAPYEESRVTKREDYARSSACKYDYRSNAGLYTINSRNEIGNQYSMEPNYFHQNPVELDNPQQNFEDIDYLYQSSAEPDHLHPSSMEYDNLQLNSQRDGSDSCTTPPNTGNLEDIGIVMSPIREHEFSKETNDLVAGLNNAHVYEDWAHFKERFH